MDLTLYNFTARMSLFSTESGGRKRPVYDHYRPSFSFGSLVQISGEVSFLETDELKPGGTTIAFVKLLPSRHVRQNLKQGDSFNTLEGTKVVGTVIIQHIDEKKNTPQMISRHDID